MQSLDNQINKKNDEDYGSDSNSDSSEELSIQDTKAPPPSVIDVSILLLQDDMRSRNTMSPLPPPNPAADKTQSDSTSLLGTYEHDHSPVKTNAPPTKSITKTTNQPQSESTSLLLPDGPNISHILTNIALTESITKPTDHNTMSNTHMSSHTTPPHVLIISDKAIQRLLLPK